MDIGKTAIKRFGKRVAELRKTRRLTQLELAARLETDQVYISRLECGKIDPTLPMIARIADCFEISVSELCDTV